MFCFFLALHENLSFALCPLSFVSCPSFLLFAISIGKECQTDEAERTKDKGQGTTDKVQVCTVVPRISHQSNWCRIPLRDSQYVYLSIRYRDIQSGTLCEAGTQASLPAAVCAANPGGRQI